MIKSVKKFQVNPVVKGSWQVWLILFTPLFALAQNINITGTAVNASQNPITTGCAVILADADLVTRSDLLTGEFQLTGTVSNISSENFAPEQSPNSFVNGQTLFFSVNKEAGDISIRVFDLSGALQANIFHRGLKPGSYSTSPMEHLLIPANQSLYLVTIQSGTHQQSYKMLVGVKSEIGRNSNRLLSKHSALLKTFTAADTLIINCVGYDSKKVTVSENTASLGEITLERSSLGPDCETDPLENESPLGRGFYQQFSGLFGCTAPADMQLYREMLPEKFVTPANPQVCFYTVDFIISGVGRYHEMAILMPITYKDSTGKYVLSMALDNMAATTGGRNIGFPKYIGDVTVTQNQNDWAGTAIDDNGIDFQALYANSCVVKDTMPFPHFINLIPIPSGETVDEAFLSPRTGSALMVPSTMLENPAYYSLQGEVLVEIGDHLPWNGLFNEKTPFAALFAAFKGGIELGNVPLD